MQGYILGNKCSALIEANKKIKKLMKSNIKKVLSKGPAKVNINVKYSILEYWIYSSEL